MLDNLAMTFTNWKGQPCLQGFKRRQGKFVCIEDGWPNIQSSIVIMLNDNTFCNAVLKKYVSIDLGVSFMCNIPCGNVMPVNIKDSTWYVGIPLEPATGPNS
jgi:hypothetical protein